jgi:hypothetical protein
MKVVSDEERERLLATGFWFDSPKEALAFRLEQEKIVREKSKKEKRKLEDKQ